MSEKEGRIIVFSLFFLQMSKKCITFAAVFNPQTLKAMKNHIFSIILAAVCCAFVACNQNEPTDTKKGGDTPTSQHQPSDPATWSPAGKRYVSDISGEDKNPYGYEQFWHVVHFFSRDSAYSYATIHEDLTPMPDMPFNTYSSYKMSYPKVITTVGIDKSEALFTDTLTLIGSSIHYLKQD